MKADSTLVSAAAWKTELYHCFVWYLYTQVSDHQCTLHHFVHFVSYSLAALSSVSAATVINRKILCIARLFLKFFFCVSSSVYSLLLQHLYLCFVNCFLCWVFSSAPQTHTHTQSQLQCSFALINKQSSVHIFVYISYTIHQFRIHFHTARQLKTRTESQNSQRYTRFEIITLAQNKYSLMKIGGKKMWHKGKNIQE